MFGGGLEYYQAAQGGLANPLRSFASLLAAALWLKIFLKK
jgi:hypothetical protein